MPYCNNCGAYIPDGQAICLACGYDPAAVAAREEAAAQQSAAVHAAGASQANDEMRQKLEEQRRRAREQNLKWAEEQKKRREEQAAKEAARKEQQEKEREWARQEYERRKAQQAQQNAAGASAAAGAHYYGSTESGYASATGEGNKALAALSYFSFLFILPSIFTPQDEYARYHAKQGMKLFIFGIIADILTGLMGIGWIATIARIYLMVKGISNAINGRKEPLPYIGTMGEK